ncbi:response regulator [Planctomyces sp. SH-PL62]|uniref:response regulator n=1 Tax=Planctomyces sp. SH-PL62 TaxID=1636152 RepID=UPI00078C45F4|nr:response regulator [Planctomyces sp. SH-PL62]AMV38730.1 DNA-binding response regulator MtrA [Planctomyces sp. SH-PL62]
MKKLAPAQGSRVLIVDDNRDTADTTAMILRMYGFDVAVAYDGRSALQKAKGYDPDVVLLDLSLPDIDGCAVAESLRNDGLDRALLIAVSGHGPDDAAWAHPYFSDRLVKPVAKDALVSLLKRLQPANS